jgi:hypothetical protein
MRVHVSCIISLPREVCKRFVAKCHLDKSDVSLGHREESEEKGEKNEPPCPRQMWPGFFTILPAHGRQGVAQIGPFFFTKSRISDYMPSR